MTAACTYNDSTTSQLMSTSAF